jgi:hypothetical protein
MKRSKIYKRSNIMDDSRSNSPRAGNEDAKEERLSEALRANLRRRKAAKRKKVDKGSENDKNST